MTKLERISLLVASVLATLVFLTFAIATALIQPRQRKAAMPWKSLAVFLIAFGLGLIIAFIMTPIIAPYIGFLAVTIYGTITLSFVLINGVITFPILIYLNRYAHTKDD